MCYLIAKKKFQRGCIALKTVHGEHLVQLKKELNISLKCKGVQLVTISRPTAFGEYAPYSFAENEESLSLRLRKCDNNFRELDFSVQLPIFTFFV